jgi:secondary thiamine-phosphate synthase enzyme
MHREQLTTRTRSEILDLTPRIRKLVEASGITEGLCLVYVPHTTAGVTINENADPDVKSDMLKKLDEMIPKRETYYDHSEGNSDSHLKTALVGPTITLIISKSKLVLGRWQGIYFCEFDGPRQREVHIKIWQA